MGREGAPEGNDEERTEVSSSEEELLKEFLQPFFPLTQGSAETQQQGRTLEMLFQKGLMSKRSLLSSAPDRKTLQNSPEVLRAAPRLTPALNIPTTALVKHSKSRC